MENVMKKPTLSVVLTVLLASQANAEVNDLFISEYVEGSSNNKAIEIANLSELEIDLTGYQLDIYYNGNSNSGLTIELQGVIPANDVFVFAHSSADEAILAVADQTSGAGLFNGDDAITLSNAGVIIDSLGQIGADPGNQWGEGLTSTQNNTIRRILPLDFSDNNPNDSFDPSIEWLGFESNDFSNLGLLGNVDEPVEPVVIQCDEPATMIHDIQGESLTPNLIGELVEIEGIVTGDYQGSSALRGFFIQEEDTDRDDKEQTSEGLFVFDNNFNVEVSNGDKVRLLGQVSEYNNMTQLSRIEQLVICQTGLDVTSESITLPLSSSDQLEQYEGMKVRFEQTLTVSENYNLGRYGQLLLSNGRLFNPTNVVLPGNAAVEMQAENDLNQILLDDGSTRQNPETIVFPSPALSAYTTVRSGDQVKQLSGIVQEAFGNYQIQATQTPEFEQANHRTLEPTLENQGLRVASFNVLNYFNGDGQGAGFPTARGADSAEEFARQRAKIINAIAAMNADIVGLMEIENDGYADLSAIADLVSGINQRTGRKFTFVKPQSEFLGGDQIAVGIIYDSEKVEEVGVASTLSTDAFSFYNRQPLVQSFKEHSTDGILTVAVNHFKSKGSCPSDSTDLNADQNDGQGCWNAKRLEASQQLLAWLIGKPTGVDDKDLLVLGDLNAYAMEDPIRYLEDNRMINLMKKKYSDKGYSYVFRGQAGTLDHALASPKLRSQILDAEVWHINADEPRALDYNTEYKSDEQIDSLYSESPYRASDHDPIIVTLKLKRDQ
jgi:uncharacterized protein